jgi:uncharacterized protein (DUF433 family)
LQEDLPYNARVQAKPLYATINVMIQIPEELDGVLVATTDTLHGAVRFAGTRVFAQSLFDYIMSGRPIEEFLDHFPDVSRAQAEQVLDWERKRLNNDFGFDLSA